jgi:hypothetical protein
MGAQFGELEPEPPASPIVADILKMPVRKAEYTK